MSLQRRHFLLVVMLAAAAATAALGQTAVPGFGPAGGGSQTQSSIPDFSTTWARLSLPGFEPTRWQIPRQSVTVIVRSC